MDFLEEEAVESSGSDEEDFIESAKRKKEAKKKRYDDSDDESEEEEDEEQIGDLINDDIEEEGASDDEEVSGKRRREDDDEEEDLEDDDYELLEENLGFRLDRKKKLKRVKRLEDSDNEDEPQDERQAIANELFDGDDDDNEEGELKRERAVDLDVDRYKRISGSEESESEEDDFIVDDNDQPVSKPKKKKGLYRHNDEAMQQAQDIFGVEFDFDDLQNLDNDDYDDYDEENEYEEDEDGDGESRVAISKKKGKKRIVKKSIFEIYEPSELERNHLTEKDNEIRNIDLPERFQLRSIPVTEATDDELKEEAEWIWKNAFDTPTISVQNPEADFEEEKHQPIAGRKMRSTVNKIKDALNFMRNKKNEVPFIAFYRKEYFVPDLNINDLWVIYKWDEKWCQMQKRKENLVKLIKNMQDYQIQKIINQTEDDETNVSSQYSRVINDKDIVRAKQCASFEDLKDCWLHFQLYYANDIPQMKQELLQGKKIKERLAIESQEHGENNALATLDEEDNIQNKLCSLKISQRKTMYTVCKEAKIIQLVRKFGLSPDQLGENLRDNYTRHHVSKCEDEPLKLAAELVSTRFTSPEQVLKAAIHMAACQISSDPLVRKCVRQVYFERARIHVRPTKKGRREIDENHPCYSTKYLKNKPVNKLVKDMYLQMHIAQQIGLLEVNFTIDPINSPNNDRQSNSDQSMGYFEEIKQLYEIDEYSKIVQLWNDVRNEALKQALEKFLYPQLEKELKAKILQESQEQCIKNCSKKLYDWLKIAPYRIENSQITDDEDFDIVDGIRVMGLAFMPNSESPAFAAILDSDGTVIEFIRLPYFLLKRHEFASEQERTLREQDRNKLRQFILNKKPHVIAVGSETMLARTVITDVNDIILKLMETDQFPPISVELVDNELSIVFQESKRAIAEFPSFPPLLRQAVSLARRLLDPLIEFSQLCTPDEEILCLKYHPLQQHLPTEELIESLYIEFINRVNEVGVDLNRCILFPHTALLVQFVCGLGPRKGASFLRSLKKKQTPILESRTQLVTVFKIGAIVFINCAGFIKIDTSQLSDNNTDTYIEVLDSTRVHPETYEWARKMAVDALEYDDDQSESNPAGALDEILKNPDKLKDLDLDAFAEELERQDLGYRRITLYDIRTELNCKYKDLREPYAPPTAEVAFHLLTRETPESFCIGKMVMGKVIGITRSRPQDDQYDKANPIRNDETNLWQCPFCLRSDYGELSDVWAHFDAKECLGQAIGIRLRLDNGVMGSIETKNISDKEIKNPEERVQIGMAIHARILRINVEKFFVNLTCRSSDLIDKDNHFKPQKDHFYAHDAEQADKTSEEESKKKKKRQTYIKRIIVHPSFHNIDYAKAEKKLSEMNNGDAIIRPSSKGINHLTLSWRVYDGITAHVDITEENKANAFSIGKQLFIEGEAYEDLDEILARYVHPMAGLAHEIISFKYFIYADGGQKETLEKLLLEEKRKQPNKIHYFLSPSKQMPGKFALAYLPRSKVIIEFVTVTPEGIRYRKNIFRSLNSLMRWFKDHFKDPIPQATPSSHIITPNINQAIQKAAATMPNHLFNTLQTLQTPTQSAHVSMGPPISVSSHHAGSRIRSNQPTPLLNTPSQNNWPMSSNRSSSGNTPASGGRGAGNDWRAQIENNTSYNRRTPRDANTRTPLYATPGASSMMSISPEHH